MEHNEVFNVLDVRLLGLAAQRVQASSLVMAMVRSAKRLEERSESITGGAGKERI